MPDLDAKIQRLIAAGASDDDIVFFIKSQPNESPAVKAPAEDMKYRHPLARLGYGLVDAVKNHPVESAAMVGGALAVPFTAGASAWPTAMAAAGLGGAGGAGLAIAGRQIASGRPEPAMDTVKAMGEQGGAQALGEGGGRVAAAGAQALGRGLYRGALLPINQILGKYGDIVKTGVEHGIPVSGGGLEQAAKLKSARLGEKAGALADADTRVSFLGPAIAQDAKGKLADEALRLANAGEPVNLAKMGANADRFATMHPQGMAPSELEAAKRTMDDRLGLAYRKQRAREPLTAKEMSRMELSQAASRAQETAVPKYREMNKGIMDAAGLQKAISRRTQGSGGNQGLENALAATALAAGAPGAVPARIAMLPPVLSRLGIGTYKAGQAMAATAPAVLKALLAYLAPDGGQE